MKARQIGLTDFYNLVHDPAFQGSDIVEARRSIEVLDKCVQDAFEWTDSPLSHCFLNTPQGTRFTISAENRHDILSRLLLLNHGRYTQEVADGFYDKKALNNPQKNIGQASFKMSFS